MSNQPAILMAEAEAKVALMQYGEVKAVLRSHGLSIWLDNERIVRRLLAEKIESGEIHDPTNTTDTVVKS